MPARRVSPLACDANIHEAIYAWMAVMEVVTTMRMDLVMGLIVVLPEKRASAEG